MKVIKSFLLSISLLLIANSNLFAQDPVFKVVEEMPRFPGCEQESLSSEELKQCSNDRMLEFVYKNLKYSKEDRDAGIQGTAVVQFIIEKDGSVSSIDVVRDPGGNCGQNAHDVVNAMNSIETKWRPGHQRGKAVRVYYTLPIRFKLNAKVKKG